MSNRINAGQESGLGTGGLGAASVAPAPAIEHDDPEAAATEYVDAAIEQQVALGYGQPSGVVRLRAIESATKAIKDLRKLWA